jgi:hypothetical protein
MEDEEADTAAKMEDEEADATTKMATLLRQ